jgi:3-isopropylmalate dehydrogenase
MRSKYDLYANLRPIRANPALAESAPLKARMLRDVDFVIIRELTSGIYFGEPRGIETLADGQRRGFNTEQYTTNQSDAWHGPLSSWRGCEKGGSVR